MKNVLLLANMEASKRAFQMLIPELEKNDFETRSFLHAGALRRKINDETLSLFVDECDILITGVSSDENLSEVELEAVELALKKGKKVFLYADTYGSWNKTWYFQIMDQVTGIFVLNEQEVEKGLEKFSEANFIATGNPTWEKYFYPKMRRELVRATLNIGDDEFLILVPAGKDLITNVLHFEAVLKAVQGKIKKIAVIFALHPGDLNPSESYQFLEYGKTDKVRILLSEEFEEISTSTILPGCDLVISSASSLGIEAACQRIPVIEYFSFIALARLEESTGTKKWPLCEMGASVLTRRPCDLNDYIYRPSLLISSVSITVRRF